MSKIQDGNLMPFLIIGATLACVHSVGNLLFTPSPYTSADLKGYKGLQACNQMCCGWVRDRQNRKFGDKCLVKCKVCTMLCMQAM